MDRGEGVRLSTALVGHAQLGGGKAELGQVQGKVIVGLEVGDHKIAVRCGQDGIRPGARIVDLEDPAKGGYAAGRRGVERGGAAAGDAV